MPANFAKAATASSFFVERNLAFDVAMNKQRILAFLQKYEIPHPHSEKQTTAFWGMCYVAILHEVSPIPTDPNSLASLLQKLTPVQTRAWVWLNGMKQRAQTFVRGKGLVGVYVDFDINNGIYTVNRKPFAVPPRLLERKKR